MRIVFLITRSDAIGGAHIHVRDMALELISDGYDVFVVIGGNGIFAEILKNVGINVVCLNHLVRQIKPLHDLFAFFEIRKILKILKPDLLSIHSAKAGVLGRIASFRMGFPVIFTAHGWSFTDGISLLKRKIFLRIEKLLAPLSTRIICVSEYDRDLALKNNLVKDSKVLTIHNGMPDLQDPENMANPDVVQPSFLMVARFDEQKDQELLLNAVGEVDGCTLALIGDGDSLQHAKDLAIKLKINDRVEFMGQVIATEEIFARYQGYILISKWEGLPRSIIEAMRAGMPVIASDVGGCSEEVKDGSNGFLIPRGDLKTLISKLSLLTSNSDLRCRMGNESRRCYENKFTFEKMYRENLRVYKESIMEQCGYALNRQ